MKRKFQIPVEIKLTGELEVEVDDNELNEYIEPDGSADIAQFAMNELNDFESENHSLSLLYKNGSAPMKLVSIDMPNEGAIYEVQEEASLKAR